MTRKRIAYICLFICTLSAALISLSWIFRDKPLLSPSSSQALSQFFDHNQNLATQPPKTPATSKVIYGFLPYWNVNSVTLQPEITHLAYFSLPIAANGNVITQSNGLPDPGYQKFRSSTVLGLMNIVKKRGGKVAVVFSQFNNDDIVNFLVTDTAQQSFLVSLDSALLAYPVDSVNIDIEYTGPVTDNLRTRFSDFIIGLHQHLQKKYSDVSLSVDIYPSAVNDTQIWDMDTLRSEVEYVIIMAYDFHRSSSIVAGPVAPLFGGRKFWNSDVTQYIAELVTRVPKAKILLGIPFYGYEWQTTSTDAQAQTYPNTGSAVTIDRVQALLADKKTFNVEEHWNDDALSPYLTYQKDGNTYVLYYENSRSVSYKLDLVNQLQLGGIAVWALGYEKDSRELWDVIKMKF